MKHLFRWAIWLAVVVALVQTARHTLDMRSWPKPQARVVRTEVEESIDDTRPRSQSERERQRQRLYPPMKYVAIVYYTFDANGMRWTGHSRGSRYSTRDSAMGQAAEFPAGRTVSVIYNPKDPSDTDMKFW